MLKQLRSVVIFPIHLCLQLSNLAIWSGFVIVFGLVRLIAPMPALRVSLLNLMHRLYFAFGVFSIALLKFFNNIEIQMHIDETLSKDKWYLITANHISYLDIVLLIDFCAPRIPPPKFFVKQQLVWLPFVGLAAWALDMPFMRRYSQSFLLKKPHLRGKDIETTRKSCEKFIGRPTTVINFVEGTRYNPKKHKQRRSPFSHLMRPKAGGLAFTLTTMGELFSNILDITIAYPKSKHPMMDMLCGSMTNVIVDVKTLEVAQDLIGNYTDNPIFKHDFQNWINQLWDHKNQRMREWMNNGN